MAQIAGFRGALWDATKVELAKVAASPTGDVAGRLGRGELVRDPSRALYRYHQTFEHGGRPVTRESFFAAVQLLPWADGVVRPHAETDAAAREQILAEIAATKAHTDAVFVGYRDAAREIDRLFRRTQDERPTVEVTTPDGTVHRLWRVQSAELIGKVRPLFAPKKLHVLDGHARYEAMLAYRDQIAPASLPTYSSANFGLACMINVEDPAIVVAARHRIVRGNELKRDALLADAKRYFIVEKLTGAAKDAAAQRAALADTLAHQPAFVALFAGDPDGYKLTLSPDVSPVDEGVKIHRAFQKLDPVVVEHLVLDKLAPGATTTTELDPGAVMRAVEGGAQLGLILRPTPLDQIIHADELGARLPAGSAAFMPPIAHLLSYVVDPDEDLV